MRKDGIIFDLDGTLWDVFDATYKSANMVTKKHNLKSVSKEVVRGCFGLNREDSAKAYFPHLDLRESLNYIEEVIQNTTEILNTEGGIIFPNLKETLKVLSNNYDLYIVSNTSQKEYIESFLNCSDTKALFKDYIAASMLKISKADAIKKVIKDNELEKAVYVGDMIKDLEATIDAGVPFVQAKYGFGNDLKTEFYINEIKELPDIINNVFKLSF